MDKTSSAVALMATVLECLKGAMVKQNVPMTTLMNLVVPYSAMMIPTMPNIIQRMVIWVVKFPKDTKYVFVVSTYHIVASSNAHY